MNVASDVLVLDDDQQAVLRVVLVQEVRWTLMHVAQAHQIFLQVKNTQTTDKPGVSNSRPEG